MNIKRMAIAYRHQVKATGNRVRKEVARVITDPCGYVVTDARSYIRNWYWHLCTALGDRKDLKDLQVCWKSLVEASEFIRLAGKYHDVLPDEVSNQVLISAKIARGYLDRFLRNLPRLIEKSLTRAVRKSGIQLS